MPSPHSPRQNQLLAALPEDQFERLRPDLELVPMPLGWALYESAGKPGYVYFPTTSVVSLLYTMESGATAEVAMTGNDGMVGIALFLGSDAMPSRAVVQRAGYGYQLKSSVLKKEFAQNSQLRWLSLRYAQSLVTQMTHTTLCNRRHSLEQQMCRWLLQSLDRLESNEVKMTPDLIGSMLGVQRDSVALAAGKLQEAGLMHYTQGHIRVADRGRLESRVCECYGQIRKETARLQPVRAQ